MAIFQQPPMTEDEIARSRPHDIPPDRVLEMDEKTWYEQVYRGDDIPQLTLRAVLMGSGLGFLLAFTNLYVGLKTGWSLGVAITACIMSYAISNTMHKAGLARSQLTILETNCMQSTASSAGYSTGTTMVSAIAALLMLSATEDNPGGEHLAVPVLGAWTFCLAILGTVLAIPMKRNLINQERLKFPSGTAAAVTLYSLYSEGSAALRKARALAVSGLGGALVPIFIDMNLWRTVAEDGTVTREPLLPADSSLFDFLPAVGSHIVDGESVPNKPSDWTIVWDHNPVMIAAGAIVGLRVAIWMFLGGLLLAYVVGPAGYVSEWTSPAGETLRATSQPWKAWREIGIWLGVPMLVSSSLLSFLLQWRTIVRALQGMMGGSGPAMDPRMAATEVPMAWFAWGVGISGLGAILILQVAFGVPFYYGILAVALTFVLSLVAARATGESDITPTGGLGKLMQLTYGVLIPQNMTANLMTAGVTSSAAASTADLLNDLKSGYLLGANPRRQFLAQLAGVFSGTIASVGGFYLLVPDATYLNGVEGKAPPFPAPAAQSWRAVAEVFGKGFENMHPMYQQAIGVGAVIGVILVLLEVGMPKARSWLPSATGIGLGMILPFQYPLSMLVGAIGAAIWTKNWPESADDLLIPVSSGVIAGISLMGVLAAFLNNVVLTG